MGRHADTKMIVMKKEVICTYRSLEIGEGRRSWAEASLRRARAGPVMGA